MLKYNSMGSLPPPPNILTVMREEERARLEAEERGAAILAAMRERERARREAEEEAMVLANQKIRATQTFPLNPLWKSTAPPNILNYYKLDGDRYVCKDDVCESYDFKYFKKRHGQPLLYKWSNGEYYTMENLQFFIKDIIFEEEYKLLSPEEQGKYKKVAQGAAYGQEYTKYQRVRGGKRRQTRRRKNKDKRKTKAKRRT